MTQVERRRAKRRPILETFSVFISIPRKGSHRLDVHDISELGMGFDLDVEGENLEDFVIHAGDSIDLKFYINQSLYLPLTLQVARIQEEHLKRRIGAEFQDQASPGYQAFLSFLKLIDTIQNIAQID